jgi:hypothetical protein
MRVSNFFDWQEDTIFENVQAAKDFMVKMEADMAKKSVSELTDKEKERALKNPDFNEIKNMLMKNPGWTLAFTRFHFLEGASMSQLKELFDDLMSKRQVLSKLPQPVEAYSKLSDKDLEDDKRPGWERLTDDLIILERKQKLKKFYNEMNSAQKALFDKATAQQINDMTEIANQFDSKGPEAFKSFVDKISRYKTLDDLINAASEFVSQYGKGFNELFDKIQELGSQVGVLYNRDGYFIFSTRSQDSIKKLCGDASWCIVSSSNYFWNYSGGRVQMNAYNFNLPVTDRLSLIGMTVEKDGKIYVAYDRTNSSISNMGSTYQQILKNAGYPSEAIEAVEKKFEDEVNIKLVLEKFFKESEGWDSRKVINSLISISRGLAKGVVSESDWEQISGAVADIIMSSEKISKATLLDTFKNNGIYSEAAWHVFDTLVGNDYTSSDMEKIKESTEMGLEDINELLKRHASGHLPEKQATVDIWKSVIDRRKEIISQIEQKMK